jgi:hypothetical protein
MDDALPVKSLLAWLATIFGVLLISVSLLPLITALMAQAAGKAWILVAVGCIAIGTYVGVRLIRYAGRTLRNVRVVQIGAVTFLACGLAFLALLNQLGTFDRSKVTLSNGVLLIQGRLDADLLAQFRRVVGTGDLHDVRVRLRSPGGDTFVGMAMGREIHRRHLDVEVDGYCQSSCANYLFTAGRRKYLRSVDQVRFHGGALEPDFVSGSLELIRQGKQMQEGEGAPPGMDMDRYRELCGLAAGIPINGVTNILAEKAYFEEIGASPLTPVYGQYGEYSAWFNDGVHDDFTYLPEDYALLGVGDVIVTEGKADVIAARSVFRAKVSASAIRDVRASVDGIYRKMEGAMSIGTSAIWRGGPSAP